MTASLIARLDLSCQKYLVRHELLHEGNVTIQVLLINHLSGWAEKRISLCKRAARCSRLGSSFLEYWNRGRPSGGTDGL